jgi:hypothetical protein
LFYQLRFTLDLVNGYLSFSFKQKAKNYIGKGVKEEVVEQSAAQCKTGQKVYRFSSVSKLLFKLW